MNEIEFQINYLNKISKYFRKVGSRVTCVPPPENTDQDYLALIDFDRIQHAGEYLDNNGWKENGSCSDFYNEDSFISFTLGDQNIIICWEDDFFRKFMIATEIAKSLNLLNKKDRIMLFVGILYNIHPNCEDLHPLNMSINEFNKQNNK